MFTTTETPNVVSDYIVLMGEGGRAGGDIAFEAPTRWHTTDGHVYVRLLVVQHVCDEISCPGETRSSR